MFNGPVIEDPTLPPGMLASRTNSWAKNAKMVRQGFYDVGIVLGAILLSDKTDMIAKMPSKFWSGEGSPQEIFVFFALALWISMIFQRYRDWHSVERLERGLDRDELERETGHRYSKDELKNLGLD